MTERRSLPWSNLQLLALAGCLFGIIAVFHLANAAHGKAFYRDIHLGTALEYAHTQVDLFKPIIVGFNATGTPTPQELPLWQAVVGLTFKALGTWFGWANLVSLLLFATCLYPLFQIAKLYYGSRCACWTLIFFLAEPLVFMHAGLASTDGFCIASTIWFLFFAIRLLRTPGMVWWVFTFVAGTIAAVSKLPFFLAAGLAIFLLAVAHHRTSPRAWLSLGAAAALIGLIFIAWTGYTNRCLAQGEFNYVDLRLSNPKMVFWYFGDWHYRLSPGPWLKGAWRFLNACFGSLALVGLFATSFLFLRQNVFARLWLAGAIVTTLVFSQLVLHHWHYYLMFTPAIALIGAQTAVAWEKYLAFENRAKALLGIGVVALVLLLSITQGLIAMKMSLLNDTYEKQMAGLITQYTKPSDKLLIQGGGWGGEALFLSHRQGLSIWDTKPLEDLKNFARLKQLGYNKLVMISESPLLFATMATTPGQTAESRESYRKSLTDVARDWPVVYQDEDILIKDVP